MYKLRRDKASHGGAFLDAQRQAWPPVSEMPGRPEAFEIYEESTGLMGKLSDIPLAAKEAWSNRALDDIDIELDDADDPETEPSTAVEVVKAEPPPAEQQQAAAQEPEPEPVKASAPIEEKRVGWFENPQMRRREYYSEGRMIHSEPLTE